MFKHFFQKIPSYIKDKSKQIQKDKKCSFRKALDYHAQNCGFENWMHAYEYLNKDIKKSSWEVLYDYPHDSETWFLGYEKLRNVPVSIPAKLLRKHFFLIDEHDHLIPPNIIFEASKEIQNNPFKLIFTTPGSFAFFIQNIFKYTDHSDESEFLEMIMEIASEHYLVDPEYKIDTLDKNSFNLLKEKYKDYADDKILSVISEYMSILKYLNTNFNGHINWHYSNLKAGELPFGVKIESPIDMGLSIAIIQGTLQHRFTSLGISRYEYGSVILEITEHINFDIECMLNNIAAQCRALNIGLIYKVKDKSLINGVLPNVFSSLENDILTICNHYKIYLSKEQDKIYTNT